ncbi:DUF72 domain-containing protein [Taibaiella sp. KBW10]|uniref:DUF72 domain-containing protein n=1 Tax=Taibaiella sp. KBW10 TaxID=2153357 RepID=UPI000F5B74FE|nr:DUF72 domain-containing protein [Taibaiella sp. KBW10]RQO30288.1 DUF72 domain-containing protein [Taibaiella sp. KBW10]
MEFGRVPAHLLEAIDFRLAEEPVWNRKVLCGASNPAPVVYTGCPKWGAKHWLGKIYPEKTKERDFLSNYIQHFNSIELNATHYKVYDEQTILKWTAAAVGKDFLFCPKMYQDITHRGALNDKQMLTTLFLNPLRAFKEHLGPVFIQLSEHFSIRRKPELLAYLATLPQDISFFLELRHPDWFSHPLVFEAFLKQLQQMNIGIVITDTAGRRDCAHMYLSIAKVFIRFVSNSLDPSDYTRLDDWVQRLKYWFDHGLETAFFFIHMQEEAMSPELAAYFNLQIKEVLHIPVTTPKFIEKNTLFEAIIY